MSKDPYAEYRKNWRKANPEKMEKYRIAQRTRYTPQQRKEKHLKNTYKLSWEQFTETLKQQDNKCAICKRAFNQEDRALRPVVDHNHTTKMVRQILCHDCNLMLGYAKENSATLQAAIAYLIKFQ